MSLLLYAVLDFDFTFSRDIVKSEECRDNALSVRASYFRLAPLILSCFQILFDILLISVIALIYCLIDGNLDYLKYLKNDHRLY